MIEAVWRIEDEPEVELAGSPRPILGTWHYLRSCLRREWLVWLGLAVVGAYVGLAAVVLVPPASVGTVTLLMGHPANADESAAMATDVSLLSTREVAVRTVRDLAWQMSPDVLQSAVTVQPVTPEVLTVAVTEHSPASAMAAVDALTRQYLAFRNAQLRSLTSGLVSGYQTRIASLERQVAALNAQYSQASQQGPTAESRASDLLAQRTELNSQIASMQQASDDASLQTEAAISSTHVLDPPRAVRPSAKRAMVLDVGSGVVAGGALGLGLVLFRALTSERLRRRHEVALALGAPVRFSVTSTGPQERRSRRVLQRLRGRGPWRRRDLDALVYGLESAIVPRGVGPELVKPDAFTGRSTANVGVAAVGGTAGVAAAVIVAVASHLRVYGFSVFLVDLSKAGAVVRCLPRPDAASVFRPTGVPNLAMGPRGARGPMVDLALGHPLRERWDAADIIIALIEVDPGIEVENLGSWVDQVVPLVSAGRCTAELLETTAGLIRSSGLSLPFAMMVGADDTDQSLGLVDQPTPRPDESSPG